MAEIDLNKIDVFLHELRQRATRAVFFLEDIENAELVLPEIAQFEVVAQLMPETLELHFVEFLLLSIKLAILALLDMARHKLLPCAICGRLGQLDDVRQ